MARSKDTATITPAEHNDLDGVVRPISLNPQLRELEGKLARLHQRRNEAAAKQEALNTQIQAFRPAGAQSKFVDDLVQNPDAMQADPARDRLSSALEDVSSELTAVDIAIKTLTDMVGPIETLKSELSAAACRAVAPIHRRNARAVVNGLLALYHAQAGQHQLHSQLWALGYERTSRLVSVHVTDFGLLSDTGSWIAAMLRDHTDMGAIAEVERLAIVRGEVRAVDVDA